MGVTMRSQSGAEKWKLSGPTGVWHATLVAKPNPASEFPVNIRGGAA